MNPRLCFLFFLLLTNGCFASVAITTPTLPNGMVKTSYSAAIQAGGGCTPYTWAVTAGALPSGISKKISANTTALSLGGTPTKAGSYSFSVSVTGCGKAVSSKTYKVVVQAAANHVVDLSWKASTSSEIAGYNIYRAPDATTWKKVNVSLVPSTVYSDSSVANGTTYYYAATAVDISGHESKKTPSVKAIVP